MAEDLKREYRPALQLAHPDFLTADQVLELGKKRVTRMRWEDGVLGIVLVLLSLLLFSEPQMAPYAIFSGICGLVNLVLAALLGSGKAGVGRYHRWLSWLGLATGAIVILALVLLGPGRGSEKHRDLLFILGELGPIGGVIIALTVMPLMIFPVRTLEGLSRIEVRAYLGIEDTNAFAVTVAPIRTPSAAGSVMDDAPATIVPAALIDDQSRSASGFATVTGGVSVLVAFVSTILLILVPAMIVFGGAIWFFGSMIVSLFDALLRSKGH